MTKRRWPIIALVFVLVFALTIVFSSSPLLRERVIRPLYIAVQIVVALVESMPRLLLWIIFAIIALQVLLRAFYSFVLEGLWNRPNQTKQVAEPPKGPVEKYAQWVTQSPKGEFFAQRLAQQLASLIVQVRQPDTKATRQQLERMLQTNSLELPPQVHAYLQNNLVESKGEGIRRSATLDTAGLDATIHYIESELGIQARALGEGQS